MDGAPASLVCPAFSSLPVLFYGVELKTSTALARSPLLLEDRVDVVHFAQPLEERDEVQQLGVGHVVEPRSNGNLYREKMENVQLS